MASAGTTPFYGREHELQRLQELTGKKTASLVIIKGRRCIGKRWDLKTADEGKHSKLRLSDNYLRFYLKYVQPNRRHRTRNVVPVAEYRRHIGPTVREHRAQESAGHIRATAHRPQRRSVRQPVFSAKNTAPRGLPDRLSDPDPAEDALCIRNQILQERRAANRDIRSAGENRAAQYAATHELSTGVDPCGRHCRKYRRTRVFCVGDRFRRADGFCEYLNIGRRRADDGRMRPSRTNSTHGLIDAFDRRNGCSRVETVGTGR